MAVDGVVDDDVGVVVVVLLVDPFLLKGSKSSSVVDGEDEIEGVEHAECESTCIGSEPDNLCAA